MKDKIIHRRAFLRETARAALGVISLPYVVPSPALGKAGQVAPSNRITVGCIGLGNQGSAVLRGFMGNGGAQIIAVCDVHTIKREGTRQAVEEHYADKHGTVFEGTEGWVHVRRGYIDANPKSILQSQIGSDEIQLYKSNDHVGNFLDCIRSRAETICPIDAAVRVDTICHISDIATRLERKLTWDPEQERFINNETANCLLARSMRSPWHL
ncbi:MAG: hypothetical protein ABIF19_10770 [Planctomycetota bacterium]